MNPIVLFDNFFVGNRRSYPWKNKLAIAEAAGFDGFEFVSIEPDSDDWKQVAGLIGDFNFTQFGFHYTSRCCVDPHAGNIDSDIEQIGKRLEWIATLPNKPYVSFSLSGVADLQGPTVHERGSAKAQDRHWERAAKLIAALDAASGKTGVPCYLYPHIDWLCDTPQSMVKILDDAKVQHVGASFCSHHWYGNQACPELDETFDLPYMDKLGYAVLTNGKFSPQGFDTVRIDLGDIDIAHVLGKLWSRGYNGPICSQGWGIGGDPYVAGKRVVDYIKEVRARFDADPKLNPYG